MKFFNFELIFNMKSAAAFFDFVGLEIEHIDQILAAFPLENTFERAVELDLILHALLQEEDKARETVLFLSLSHIPAFSSSVKLELRAKVTPILVAWPEELELYGNYPELIEKYDFFEILEQPVKQTTFSLLLKKLERHWKKQETLQLHALQELEELKALRDINHKLAGHTEIIPLLKMARQLCQEVTNADAVCIYLVIEREGIGYNKENYLDNKQLHYEPDRKNCAAISSSQSNAINDGWNLGYAPILLTTIPGYVTITQKVLRIKDAYNLSYAAPYDIDKLSDAEHDYRTKSMLVVPITSRGDEKQTLGVIQLVNKKINPKDELNADADMESMVVDFSNKDERLVKTIALHAGICYQSLILYNNEQKLLEGFIKASVKAIESRDPTTSGHSSRVARLVVAFAKAVSNSSAKAFRHVKYTPRDLKEIEYAALLHDFGKIGVRESVLVKANKLHPSELTSLLGRYKVMLKAIQLRFTQKKLGVIARLGKKRATPILREIDKNCHRHLEETLQNLQTIFAANAASHNGADLSAELERIKSKVFYSNESEEYEYLTDEEYKQLTLKTGTLSQDERNEIQQHVSHSFDFLRNIPWTDDLKQIPLIVYAHHERNDGSGYPNGLVESTIPIPSKMMAIADIFDALTSPERPYKKAMSIQVALNMLENDAKNNKIDLALFTIFREEKIYEAILDDK